MTRTVEVYSDVQVWLDELAAVVDATPEEVAWVFWNDMPRRGDRRCL